MKPVTFIKLLGKRWRINLESKIADWGDCDPPEAKNRTVRISKKARGKKRLEVLIHEMQHACNFFPLSEEYVKHTSRDIANALWRLGYRHHG